MNTPPEHDNSFLFHLSLFKRIIFMVKASQLVKALIYLR